MQFAFFMLVLHVMTTFCSLTSRNCSNFTWYNCEIARKCPLDDLPTVEIFPLFCFSLKTACSCFKIRTFCQFNTNK